MLMIVITLTLWALGVLVAHRSDKELDEVAAFISAGCYALIIALWVTYGLIYIG